MKTIIKRFKIENIMWTFACLFIMSIISCGSDDENNKDMTRPVISDKGITVSPINCDVYHPGDVIYFRYLLEDNQELGNFTINIHDNFDHHSHGTESDEHEEVECEGHEEHHEEAHGDESGVAWKFSQDYEIPAGQKSYVASVDIPIPEDVRHGDYHLMINVTDKATWNQFKIIAIRIEEKE